MRIILAVILAMMVGCATATTVPKKDYDSLKATLFKVSADKEKCVQKWQPSDTEIKEHQEATVMLEYLVSPFIEEFAKHMSQEVDEKVEVKADDIGFIDNHNGALVRMWVSLSDTMVKYYLLFVRNVNGDWMYQGYFKVGDTQY